MFPGALNIYDSSGVKHLDINHDNDYIHIHSYENTAFHFNNDIHIPTKYDNETGFINVASELKILKDMINSLSITEPEPESEPEPEPEPESEFINLLNSSTTFYKAYDFNGTSGYAIHGTNSTLYHPIYLNGNYSYPVNVSNGKTATSTGSPWELGFIVKIEGDGTIFRQGSNITSYARIRMYIENNKLKFHVGTNSNYLRWTSTQIFNGWNAIYVDYNGGSTGGGSSDLSKFYSRYRLKQVDLQSGIVSNISGTWAHSNYGYTGTISVPFVIGRNVNTNYGNFKISHLSINTLPLDSDLPDDIEINKYVLDPIAWKLTKTSWRQPGTVYDNVPLTNQNSHYANKLYLFGNTYTGGVDQISVVRNVWLPSDGQSPLSLAGMSSSSYIYDTTGDLYPIS